MGSLARFEGSQRRLIVVIARVLHGQPKAKAIRMPYTRDLFSLADGLSKKGLHGWSDPVFAGYSKVGSLIEIIPGKEFIGTIRKDNSDYREFDIGSIQALSSWRAYRLYLLAANRSSEGLKRFSMYEKDIEKIIQGRNLEDLLADASEQVSERTDIWIKASKRKQLKTFYEFKIGKQIRRNKEFDRRGRLGKA